MLGRSLFSLCVVVVLAIQSCTAAASTPVIQDGVYKIVNVARGYLTSQGQEKGTPVILSDTNNFEGSQEWEVLNVENDLVLIRNLASGFHLAPIDPRNIRFRQVVVQAGREFQWAVQYDEDDKVYRITTHRDYGLRLGAPPPDFPPLVRFEYSDIVPEQAWKFIKVSHQTRTDCKGGPWRISRHELYLQETF
ncbi:MAG: hypothetical protein J3Q66DRAFT_347210 [Benniella sp.]|nr:MAG: hypothetical protein J3Q66DRAFT_347210 [Benniella sp.]